MKKICTLFGLAICASLLFSACSEKFDLSEPETDIKKVNSFCLFASVNDTRTTNDGLSTKWAELDAINVFYAESGSTDYSSNAEFTIDDLNTGRFLGTLPEELDKNKSYDWYTLYPYNEFITTPANTGSGYLHLGSKMSKNSAAAQLQDGVDNKANLCGQYFPLYGKATAVEAETSPMLSLKQVLCVLKINVTNNSGEALAVSTIKVTSDSLITGSYYINFANEKPSFIGSGDDYVSNVVTLNVSNAELANSNCGAFYLAIKPFTAQAGDQIKISVNGYEKTITLSNNKEFASGHIVPIGFNFDKVSVKSKYTLVTSIDDVTNGDYIITAKNSGSIYSFMNGEAATGAVSAVALSDDLLPVNDTITTTNDSFTWTFTGTTSAFTITSSNNSSLYLYSTNENNGVSIETTEQNWSIVKVTDGFNIKNGSYTSRKLALYSTSNWRTYATSSGIQLIKLYKKLYPALATPVVTISEQTVQWNAIANASKYIVEIDNKTKEVTTNSYTYNASDFKLATGDYDVKVTAVPADGAPYSKSEAGVSTTKLHVESTSPIISPISDPAKVAASGSTSVEVSYTITNPTGASVSASTSATWIKNFNYATAGKIIFEVEANTGAERSATVTVSYPEAEDKTFTVTQEGTTIYTWTLGSGQITTAAGTYKSGDVTWSYPTATYIGYDGSKGVQIGSSSNPTTSWNINTEYFNDITIKAIKVNASMGSKGNAKLSIKVGGTTVLDNINLTTSAKEYSATSISSKGKVEIIFSATSKAYYLKSISIEY